MIANIPNSQAFIPHNNLNLNNQCFPFQEQNMSVTGMEMSAVSQGATSSESRIIGNVFLPGDSPKNLSQYM